MSDERSSRVYHQLAIPVFSISDMPNMGHCKDFSLYKGVLVQWDEDRDPRILEFIDSLPDDCRRTLLVAQEHEGTLSMLWDGVIPERYPDRGDVGICGDNWGVESKSIG